MTAKVKYVDKGETTPVLQSLEFGGVTFQGFEYSE
jgi:hypothetical protein